MKVRYIGDPKDNFAGPPVIVYFGEVFQNGQWVTLDDKDPQGATLRSKLAGNGTFEIDGKDADNAPEAAGFDDAVADEKKRHRQTLKDRGVSVSNNATLEALREKVAATDGLSAQEAE